MRDNIQLQSCCVDIDPSALASIKEMEIEQPIVPLEREDGFGLAIKVPSISSTKHLLCIMQYQQAQPGIVIQV